MGLLEKGKGFLLAGILSMGGLGLGMYLFLLHHRKIWGLSNPSGICGAMSETGCEIAMGESGMLFGIPIAVIGLSGAFATLLLAFHAYKQRQSDQNPSGHLLWLLALVSVMASAAMGVVSVLDGRFCPVCVIWYGVNIALLVTVWWQIGGGLGLRVLSGFQAVTSGPGRMAILCFLAFLGSLSMKYHGDVAAAEERKVKLLESQRIQVKEELAKKTSQEVPEFPDAPRKMSAGTEGPLIRIVEFSDLECPFCRRLWGNLEEFMGETPSRVSLEFIHYPLNKDCNENMRSQMHENACVAAKAAICAQEQAQFWSYTEAAFGQQRDLEREDLLALAEEMKLDRARLEVCIDAESTEARLRKDVQRASELGIKGTPFLLVNGLKLSGALSPEIFQMVADELAK